jgi:hypothetical protein
MHITQGFGNFGGRGGGGPNEQIFIHLDGDPARQDLMDGIDTTWSRVRGGAEIGAAAAALVAQFKGDDPAASVPALLALRGKLATVASDPVVDDKRAQLDRILQACLGLTVATAAAQPEVVPGEKLEIRATVSIRSDVAVRWMETRVLDPRSSHRPGLSLKPGQPHTEAITLTVPADAPPSQPYWLRQDGGSGIARVDDPLLIGLPENPPAFPVEHVFEVGGQTLVVADEPRHVTKDPKGDRLRRVDVIPPVSLRFASDVSIFRPGATRPVTVEVAAARPATSGTLELELPAGWSASPGSHSFQLGSMGENATFTFNVTAPANPAAARITASAKVKGSRYRHQRIEINYGHLPFILLQPLARARVVSIDVNTRGTNVGYLPGAGDDTAEALEQLGYKVTTLAGADLVAEKLRGLDAVVIGVRAFNERKDLPANLPALFRYVEEGGTVIAQYNRPSGSLTELGPYPLSIAGSAPQWRVTDEKSPVTFLAPDHAALTTPNRIGPADFEGWVQERGAYFPSSWDKGRYTPVLALNDPGETPLESGVLIARHGRGHYVYTGLAFFRQLPAGVPGAYRLFANLVSLGK